MATLASTSLGPMVVIATAETSDSSPRGSLGTISMGTASVDTVSMGTASIGTGVYSEQEQEERNRQQGKRCLKFL